MKDRKFPEMSNLTIEMTLNITGENISKKSIVITPLRGKSKTCVYMIKNEITGEFYIGQTRNIFNRMIAHTRELIKGTHISKKMCEDWKNVELQKEAFSRNTRIFEFYILVYCRPTELSFYENALIKALNPAYNTHK